MYVRKEISDIISLSGHEDIHPKARALLLAVTLRASNSAIAVKV